MKNPKEKLITVIVPNEIHDKLTKIKKTTGATVSFQINQILHDALIKKGAK